MGHQDFEIALTNFSVISGTEGVSVLSGLSLQAGATGRYPLGGAAARQLVLRQPNVVRSLQLAQVDILADAAVIAAGANALLSSKPLSYPAVYDMKHTMGSYVNPSDGAATSGELAPLAVDGYESTAAASCARLGPGAAGEVSWLLVDLGSSDVSVHRVDLLPSADPVLASELAGIEVLVGNTSVRGG